MNKQKFIELVDNPSGICEKDAGILADLAAAYPYSSLVHTMLAKALRNSRESKESLATAAVFIPDRSVLKAVMEDQLVKISSAESEPIRVEDSAITAGKVREANNNVSASIPPAEPIPEQEMENKNDVFLELQENMKKLKEQRDLLGKQGDIPEAPEEDGNSRLHLNREEDQQDQTGTSGLSTPPHRLGTLPEPLQELLDTKEEKEINDPKRKEQINLIDNFLKNSSSISRKYRSAEELDDEQNDLTSEYAFTPPDLATENLAQIMVRQGKTDKAIDIYGKLILKYPQKKAYFASCIEKLKTT